MLGAHDRPVGWYGLEEEVIIEKEKEKSTLPAAGGVG